MNASNLFFDLRKLRSCGSNVIIGKTVRIRYPNLVEIGDNCIIDDFTYISTGLKLEQYTHIAAGCKLIGGPKCRVQMGRFSTLAPNVVLSAGSDDYDAGIATPFVPEKYKGEAEYGEIVLGHHCIVGAASVVLPNVTFGDGASVGALSLVKRDLKKWILYAGIPAREIRRRNRKAILKAEASFEKEQHG
jgi:dTDP-4-amino-4,6-dideoxy-D-glucose acyltransferase